LTLASKAPKPDDVAGRPVNRYGKIIPPAQIKQRLSEVKPAQIRAVAREFLRPERMNLALVSPLKSEAGLAKILRA